jgi:uncharacterized membrane protein
MKTNAFLHALDNERIVAAILEAENRSRGEIRVHVSNQEVAVAEVEAAARAQFEKLEMTKSALRNGVLIYVAPRSQKFAVIGDAGIHACCGATFWSDVAAAMEADFRAGRFTDGIVEGVKEAGDALARHFPREGGPADVNELANDVTHD